MSFTPLLDGAPAKPQQAMLAAASKAHPGLTAYAVAKAQKGGSHVASLGTAAIEKQLGSLVSSAVAAWGEGSRSFARCNAVARQKAI